MSKTKRKTKSQAKSPGSDQFKPIVGGGAFFLKWFRERRGLSTRALARKLGVAYPHISLVETNRKRMQFELFRKIYKISTHEERRMLLESLHREIDSYMEEID